MSGSFGLIPLFDRNAPLLISCNTACSPPPAVCTVTGVFSILKLGSFYESGQGNKSHWDEGGADAITNILIVRGVQFALKISFLISNLQEMKCDNMFF